MWLAVLLWGGDRTKLNPPERKIGDYRLYLFPAIAGKRYSLDWAKMRGIDPHTLLRGPISCGKVWGLFFYAVVLAL